MYHIEEQGWHDGENAHPPPMWSRFDFSPVPYVGWVCWFLPCYEGFALGSSVFLPPQNPTSPNSTRIEDLYETKTDVASSLNTVILTIFFFIRSWRLRNGSTGSHLFSQWQALTHNPALLKKKKLIVMHFKWKFSPSDFSKVWSLICRETKNSISMRW